jgi:hypothetical protein
MVIPAVMFAAVLAAVSVSVLVPAPLIGLKDAVTPDGTPGGVKLTVLLVKPPEGVIVIVLVALAPGATVTLLGDADKLKFGVATTVETVRLKFAVWLNVPEVPLSVMG